MKNLNWLTTLVSSEINQSGDNIIQSLQLFNFKTFYLLINYSDAFKKLINYTLRYFIEDMYHTVKWQVYK